MKTRILLASSILLPALLLSALLSLGCFRMPDEEAFQAGMDAYSKGDFEAAMKKWKPLAQNGNPSAQTNVGVMYFEGQGVPRNDEEALKWYTMAAMQGYAEAEYNVGLANAQGRGVPQNNREALRWYRLSAARGYLPAQVSLAEMYYRGEGIAVDYAEAARWYGEAANQGQLSAAYVLGTMYAIGQGVPKDYVKSYMWLTVASAPSNEQGRQMALNSRDLVAKQMTKAQIADAEKQAGQWQPKRAVVAG